jgi:hypothetical protein
MVFTLEGNYMKKKKAEALYQRLVKNEISRPEFEELLKGLEDTEMTAGLEEVMRTHFDAILSEHDEKIKFKTKEHKVYSKNSKE